MHFKNIIIVIIVGIANAKIYDCGTKEDVYLEMNEMAFFQTTSFPDLMTYEDYYANCKISFKLNTKYFNKTYKRVLSFTNVNADGGDYPNAAYFTRLLYEINSPTFSLPYAFYRSYGAQQGAILFDDTEGESCPLESISRNQPYQFQGETQVLYILSRYEDEIYRKHPCKWKFEAPSGYGFKILLLDFLISSKTRFIIENSTQVIVTERSAKTLHPYYNADSFIQISLSIGDPNFTIDDDKQELRAFVSIIKNKVPHIEGKCKVTKNEDDEIIWTNFDGTLTAYKTNFRCTFDLVIPPKTEVLADVKELCIEDGADFVRFYPDKYNSVEVTENLNTVFVPFYDACGCAPSLIPCDGQYYTIMNNTDYYCGNLNCTFTILPCPTLYSMFDLQPNFQDLESYDLDDVFQVISNGEMVLDVDNINRGKYRQFVAYLNTRNTNTFEIRTYPSHLIKELSFSIKSYNLPRIDLILTLSPENPNFTFDMGYYEAVLVQVSEALILDKTKIILYSGYANLASVYNNETLTKNIVRESCFDDRNPNRCIIHKRKFVIVGYNPIMAVRLSGYPKGCVFEENIFIFDYNTPISAIARADEECIITIIQNVHGSSIFIIPSLWTTATKENVKIFVGTDQTNLLLEFNSQTAAKWKDIVIISTVYTIVIPKSSAFYMSTFGIDNDDLMLTIDQFPYESIVTTPYYGVSPQGLFQFDPFVTYNISKYPVKFTVINYGLNDEHDFCFKIGGLYGTPYYINKTGASVTFHSELIGLSISCDIETIVSNGILLLVETLNSTHNL